MKINARKYHRVKSAKENECNGEQDRILKKNLFASLEIEASK